ncbi:MULTISPECIES: competence/damage-inducible protein A [Methylosinus]|uniref:Competence/damage-inducible protein A n=1 Tax=Methylosinus trichosporium (strain ATCC 35070 / NCIMB 11131 / UNIQEM 75 / OB3b) TaxID=595536 RepID=A0A2D2CWP8_METT3|nr:MULTISPECIES: molybdopterin-binding protein [Methylosinus]ATQ67133.1 competence/damage-inducible protein A [Methylosinus trichosporium OB3b]OBS52714.1 molybdenum cofactor biosynthesis protein [Methylosinus sp. 3S-1]
MEQNADITAAVLVIGDEILSGRTQDQNSTYIARYLAEIGVDLREVRVVPDIEAEIVAALDALRRRYTYVFTTGGIGPTHDDITADAVAKAFGVAIGEDERALAMLLERIPLEQLNPARRRMARIPAGATLIENAISKAPGFMIGNVVVMAGVPVIMQAMLDAAAVHIVKGAKVMVATIDAHDIPEGRYAADLEAIAKAHEKVTVGSYPSFSSAGVRNQIVLRSRDANELEKATQEARALIARLHGERTLI